MITWIMFFVYVQIYIAMLWSAKSLIHEKSGRYFGLSLSSEQRQDPEVQRVVARYHRRLQWFFAACGAAIVPCVWPQPYMAVTYSALMLYMMLIFVVPALWAVQHGEAIKAVKEARGWYSPLRPSVVVDTRASRDSKLPRAGLEWYLIAMAISYIPLVTEIGDLWLRGLMTAIGFGVTLLLYVCALILLRGRNKVYSVDSELNVQLNYSLKSDLTRWFGTMAIVQALVNMGMLQVLAGNQGALLEGQREVGFMAMLVLSSAVPLAGAAIIYLRQRRRLEASLPGGDAKLYEACYTEDERYWYGGLFYRNPHNPKLFVSSAHGMQSAVNLGTKGGRTITWALAIFLVVILVPLWVVIVVDELQPFRWSVEAEVVRLESSLYRTQFPLEAVVSVALVDTAELTSKRNGSATERYAVGYFKSRLYGPVKVYLYRDSKPIIKVVLEDKVLLVAARTPEETLAFFRQLGGEMK